MNENCPTCGGQVRLSQELRAMVARGITGGLNHPYEPLYTPADVTALMFALRRFMMLIDDVLLDTAQGACKASTLDMMKRFAGVGEKP